MVPLQRHLRQRQPEEDEVLRVRLHGHRVADLRPAQLPRYEHGQGAAGSGVMSREPLAHM